MPFPWSKPSGKAAGSSKNKSGSQKDKLEGVLPKLHQLGKKLHRPASDDDGSVTGSSFESPRKPLDSAAARACNFAKPMAKGQALPHPSEVHGYLVQGYNQFELKMEAADPLPSGYASVSISSASSVSSAEVPDWLSVRCDEQNAHAIHIPQAVPRSRYDQREVQATGRGQIVQTSVLRSAPTSLLSSPCQSPRRLSTSEQQFGSPRMLQETRLNAAYLPSSAEPGFFILSPEKSPLASPARSPRPGSRIHSAASPRSAVYKTEALQGHPLPHPPASSYAPSSPVQNCVTRWQKGSLLGYGSFGRVYKGFSDCGTFCAMKEVLIVDDPKSKESVKQLMQEINILSSLRHANIVQYLGSELLHDRLYIYLEYVSGGSIQKVLEEYGAFKEPVIRSYTQQILSGLAYLHSMNKVHRDIKGSNILVDTNGEVKLADFGMAKHITSNSLVLSFKGSPYWMAPEVFKNTNSQKYPVDIWSLGCTIIEMATGKPPWSQYEGVAAMFKIGNSKELPELPDMSPEGQSFIRLCLQREPADRPTAAQLLEHPFVKLPWEEPTSPSFAKVAEVNEQCRSSQWPASPLARSRMNSGASTPPRKYDDLGSPMLSPKLHLAGLQLL